MILLPIEIPKSPLWRANADRREIADRPEILSSQFAFGSGFLLYQDCLSCGRSFVCSKDSYKIIEKAGCILSMPIETIATFIANCNDKVQCEIHSFVVLLSHDFWWFPRKWCEEDWLRLFSTALETRTCREFLAGLDMIGISSRVSFVFDKSSKTFTRHIWEPSEHRRRWCSKSSRVLFQFLQQAKGSLSF